MNTQERQATFSLASIYTFRMLGLFMILPVFSLYTHSLKFANPFLIGLALGVYGLTQACLQIPFGLTSDRIGRKPVIVFGLLLFMLGSVIAALSHDIYWIIVGRALQGAGAVGSALIALVADTTRDEHRLKAMSLIGMTIGLSFILAMILGPILNDWIGLSGIFWLTAAFALLGIFILFAFVPSPKSHLLHRDSEPVLSQFKNVLKSRELLRLDFGIFTLHATLMALFIIIPLFLTQHLALAAKSQWMFYLPVLLIACIIMFPFVGIAEAKRLIKPIFIIAVAALVLVELCLFFGVLSNSLLGFSILLCVFFTAFTLLEGILPSLISKIAPIGSKGTAMGVYSSAQFLGIFFGGTIGGLIVHDSGSRGVYLFCALLGLLWLFLAVTMKQPPYLSSQILKLNTQVGPDALKALKEKIKATPGVAEVLISAEEGIAYLKVDKRKLAKDAFSDF